MLAPVRTVQEYLRELAGADEGESNRAAFSRLERAGGGPLAVNRATLYRYVEANDCGDGARAILDALDARRQEAGVDLTTIDDYRALTAGRAGLSATARGAE